jgi:hypothetical protein
MKKITAVALTAVLFISSAYNTYAQENTDIAINRRISVTPAFLVNSKEKPEHIGNPLNLDLVHDNVLKDFNSFFPQGQDVEWYPLDSKFSRYVAYFNNDGNRGRAVFSRKAGMEFSLFYIPENQLPADNRKALKSNYVDYVFKQIMKISLYGETHYVVNLRNKANVVMARVRNGSIDELNNFVDATVKE